MHKISIKPISINKCFKGRRFKTPSYKQYHAALLYMLPKKIDLFDKMELQIEVGFSYAGSDLDNVIKPFQDALQVKYGFNDSAIYKITAEKIIVKKGSEYIRFNLNNLNR